MFLINFLMKNYKSKKRNFWENFRFEFILNISNGRRKEDGNNIICQRLFDVKGYNEDVLKSVELKELMDTIAGTHNGSLGSMGILPNHFKKLSKKVCWDTYNPYRINTGEENRNVFEYEDIFTFQIRVDKKVVAETQFSGNWFQTDVRYAVDIREIIPKIIEEIQDYFSRDEYTTSYGAFDLNFEFAPYDFETN
jgi:hypothetical protein